MAANGWTTWIKKQYEYKKKFKHTSDLITNRTCSIFVPVYGTSFLVRVFGGDFWYVCHGHKT